MPTGADGPRPPSLLSQAPTLPRNPPPVGFWYAVATNNLGNAATSLPEQERAYLFQAVREWLDAFELAASAPMPEATSTNAEIVEFPRKPH
jgi:hypothetical protein